MPVHLGYDGASSMAGDSAAGHLTARRGARVVAIVGQGPAAQVDAALREAVRAIVAADDLGAGLVAGVRRAREVLTAGGSSAGVVAAAIEGERAAVARFGDGAAWTLSGGSIGAAGSAASVLLLDDLALLDDDALILAIGAVQAGPVDRDVAAVHMARQLVGRALLADPQAECAAVVLHRGPPGIPSMRPTWDEDREVQGPTREPAVESAPSDPWRVDDEVPLWAGARPEWLERAGEDDVGSSPRQIRERVRRAKRPGRTEAPVHRRSPLVAERPWWDDVESAQVPLADLEPPGGHAPLPEIPRLPEPTTPGEEIVLPALPRFRGLRRIAAVVGAMVVLAGGIVAARLVSEAVRLQSAQASDAVGYSTWRAHPNEQLVAQHMVDGALELSWPTRIGVTSYGVTADRPTAEAVFAAQEGRCDETARVVAASSTAHGSAAWVAHWNCVEWRLRQTATVERTPTPRFRAPAQALGDLRSTPGVTLERPATLGSLLQDRLHQFRSTPGYEAHVVEVLGYKAVGETFARDLYIEAYTARQLMGHAGERTRLAQQVYGLTSALYGSPGGYVVQYDQHVYEDLKDELDRLTDGYATAYRYKPEQTWLELATERGTPIPIARAVHEGSRGRRR